jgi:hypothetical protein
MEATSCSSSWLLLSISLAIVAAALSFLFRLVRHGRVSRRQLPPGLPTVVFLAKALPLLRSLNDLSPLLLNLHMQYGPIFSIRLIFRTFIFVTDRGICEHKVDKYLCVFVL